MKLKLKELKDNSKGMIFEWIVILVGCFLIFIMWASLDVAVTDGFLNASLAAGADPVVIGHLTTLWDLWPIGFSIGLFIFGFLASSKDQGYSRGI